MITLGLYKHADIEAFKTALDDAGYSHINGVSLKRFFTVFDVNKESFSLWDHPSIQVIEEDLDSKLSAKFTDQLLDYRYGGRSSLPYDSDNWGLARICRRKNPFPRQGKSNIDRLDTSFRYTRSGQGVIVYICDVGYSGTHPDYVGRITHLRPELGGYFITAEGSSHGVNVASLAAGTFYGVAKNAEIYFSPIGPGPEIFRTVAAMDDCITHYLADPAQRPAVMNCSFAGIDVGGVSNEIYADVIDLGICIANSASNDREDHDDPAVNISPTNQPDMIAVGACSINDTPMNYHRYGTAYGTLVALFAPGEKVIGASEEVDFHGTLVYNGTSMAAPHACGVIACMLEGYQRPTTRAQVQAIKAKLIENSTKDVLDFPESSNCFIRGNNRLLYLDPHVTIEPIPGLIPL